MSTRSTLLSAAYIAAIASVIGVLGAPAFANDAATGSVLRDLGNAPGTAQAFRSGDQSAAAARAQYLDGSQRSTQRVRSSDIVVNASPSFDSGRLGHN
jgi:hypothetical protein